MLLEKVVSTWSEFLSRNARTRSTYTDNLAILSTCPCINLPRSPLPTLQGFFTNTSTMISTASNVDLFTIRPKPAKLD